MSTNVCSKFRCAALHIKKAVGIFREVITRTATKVAFLGPAFRVQKLIKILYLEKGPTDIILVGPKNSLKEDLAGVEDNIKSSSFTKITLVWTERLYYCRIVSLLMFIVISRMSLPSAALITTRFGYSKTVACSAGQFGSASITPGRMM